MGHINLSNIRITLEQVQNLKWKLAVMITTFEIKIFLFDLGVFFFDYFWKKIVGFNFKPAAFYQNRSICISKVDVISQLVFYLRKLFLYIHPVMAYL